MYYDPYAQASQHSLSWEMLVNLYIILTINLFSFNLKNEKGMFNGYNFFIWA